MPQYDVRANLLIQARNSYGEVRKLSSEVRQLGENLKTTQSATRGALTQMIAFGGAFLGIRAISGAFVSLTRSAVGYTAELEKTKIGLQTVLMAVENTDWETAGKRAGAAFEKIREMAIKSPATSAEMFGIFNGIVGPVEAAGFAMSKVLDMTQDTTLAASALGVDFAQATRDVNMMVRGTAGAEVKLFSMLRSTGAIKEDAQAWNALAPEKRINLLSEALKKFAKGGAAFGSSWAGVTSTLQDIFDNLKASAFAPIMKTIAGNIERFNSYILANRVAIEVFLTNVGRGLANRIQTVFSKVQMGFEYLVENWDSIVDRFHEVVKMVREVAPQIARAALAWEAVNLGRNLVGGALTAGSGLMGAVGAAGEGGIGALLGGAGGKAASAAVGASMGVASPFGLMGAAGGGATVASPFGMMGAGAAGTGAAGAVGTAGFAAALTALAPVLAIVAVALVALVAVGMAFADQWRAMAKIFGEAGGQTLMMLYDFGRALWDTLAPVLKFIGSVLLVPLTALWIVFSTALRGALLGLTWLLRIFALITNAIWTSIKPAFDLIFQLFASLSTWLTDLFGRATQWLHEVEKKNKEPVLNPTEELSHEPNMDYALWPAGTQNQIDLNKAAKGGVNITQDFRGSRISIKQDFKGDQDPDRIVMAMMSDLTRQAENRTSSGYAGALTR